MTADVHVDAPCSSGVTVTVECKMYDLFGIK